MAYKIAFLAFQLFTLTTTQKLSRKKISGNVKDDILNSDISVSQAFEMYMEAYTDPEVKLMLTSTGPNSHKRQRNVFSRNLNKCKSHNEKFKKGETSYQCTVNSFIVMDTFTRKQYLGLSQNMSLLENGKYTRPAALQSSGPLQALPNTFDWNKKGYVTPVKNQGGCGSCWSYGAIGPIEYAYKAATGKLLSFSEQELLDCTYEHLGSDEDGCEGSWYTSAWDFVIEKNHLPSEANYPYKEKDGKCFHNSHSNDIAGKIQVTGYTQSAKTETAVLTDLVNKMPLAVAFTVEDNFYSVGEGIYDGCKDPTYPNHAVILTGYGSNFFEIKNSWGADWGMNGFARFERGRDICGILSYAYYIEYNDLYENDGGNGGDDQEDEGENEDEEEEQAEVKECKELSDELGLNYRGTKSTTVSGLPCQNWESQSPNYHSRTPENYPDTGLESNNYCRNPDHEGAGPWCYNSQSTEPRWEYCDVPVCGEEEEEESGTEGGTDLTSTTEMPTESDDDCLPDDDLIGVNYRGFISMSESGLKCQSWNRQRPNKHSFKPRRHQDKGLEENYCRNPDEESERPWCYNSHGVNPRWEYCTIPKCEKKGQDSSCTDDHEYCTNWAYENYCSNSEYEEFMVSTCRKSCKVCREGGEAEEAEEATEKTCVDEEGDCPTWAESGYCQASSIYSDYMELNCEKSCAKCGEEEGGDNEKCGGGLTRCSDGSCKHIHMC
ncbi:uncharacterized protein LOC134820046 [Bolinopsis microptera]|uniref:uncharacterized protein LOC134820046 n=1 Tax=Bolinopsis microptera TaxID=2820187 RepID=UPI00307AAFCC